MTAPSRRNFLKLAGLAAVPVGSGTAAADETLAGYRSHTADRRTVTVTSTTGQQLRITAYGGHMLRVRAVRSGETFFADDRYEMVDPAAHTGLGGSLAVTDAADRLTIAAAGLRVVLTKDPVRLEFAATDGTRYAGEDATHSLSWGADGVRQTFTAAAAGERFVKAGHGLYGRAPKIDRTGDIVAHNYGLQSQHIDQAPAIVPLYLSSRGYAVFFNTTFDTTFNFGSGGIYEFSADGHGAPGVRPQLDYFVIAGPTFAGLLDRYTQLTGRPRFPRLGVFGLQLSDKNFPQVSDQNWWTTRITALRAAGYPLDVQVNDNRWRAGSGGWSGSWFEFSPQRWPDPAAFKRWADEHGVLTTLDYNRNNSNEMAGWNPAYGFAPADVTAVSDNDAVPDWSNPNTRSWLWTVFWTKALDPRLGYPGDALWIDEPDEMGPIPYGALAANGQRWAELRNAFFLYCQKAAGQEGWDRGRTGRPWIFTRGATAGQQRYGHLWTGDINSTYAEMKEQIRGMQNAGLGGFPFANIDGGGFFGAVLSNGMYRNWVAAWSSLSPVWRPHSNGDTGAQGPAASRWPIDQGATEQADFMKYARVRYTLMPYIYTVARLAHATGVPMARAMVVEHQNNPMAYTHDLQYMWGPSILVMPVTTDTGGAVQNVWLPAGDTWYNFWSDAKNVGSDTVEKSYVTSTGEIIMYVKAGSLLPKYKYAHSTAFLDKTQLEVEVYTGQDGSFEVYEDDGVTEIQASSSTRLAFVHAALRVTINHPVGTYAGAPTSRRYVVRYHGLSAAVGMRVNGGAVLPAFTSESAAILNGSGQVWNAARRVLSVITPAIGVLAGGGAAATIEPSGAAFPPSSPVAVYEAEDATRSGPVLATQHAGYTGTAYVDYPNTTGAYLEWTVAVPTAGAHPLRFRYTNGGAADRPLQVTVNGTVAATLSFPPTGDWKTWRTATLTATLPAGTTVRIRATATTTGGPNLDSLTLG
ncbi:carbohydrate-binding protein [Actinoplanes sp. TRM 88003]|uniref:Carbohydrate-binding protein n=1 Tax=Paractinoplanes aksuensis TaxID=2939490 RepID=A0ABT1DVE3_9ACTN|nr:TIM-barrel domain-containing protein [Actinoplanes aksuensis]MCO8274026.1 carbohydrate-binding protein [Actinoplanes aksuensis]